MASHTHFFALSTALLFALSGCPASNQPDGAVGAPPDTPRVDTNTTDPPIPDIPPETRIVDLDDEQLTALCEYWLAMLGSDRDVCTNGQVYTVYSQEYDPIEWCISEYHLTRDLRPDCPQLVRSDIRFIQHVKAHCHDPDFDALDFDGHRGCMGP